MMHSKASLVVSLFGFLSLLTVVRAALTKPPISEDHFLTCIGKIPECDMHGMAHNLTTCFAKSTTQCMDKISSRDLALEPREASGVGLSNAALAHAHIVALNKYNACTPGCVAARTQCEKYIPPPAPPRLNDCPENYDACITACKKSSGLTHRDPVGDVEIVNRDTHTDIEARDMNIDLGARDLNIQIEPREDVSPFAAAAAVAAANAKKVAVKYATCTAACKNVEKQCERPTPKPVVNDCLYNYNDCVAICHSSSYGRDLGDIDIEPRANINIESHIPNASPGDVEPAPLVASLAARKKKYGECATSCENGRKVCQFKPEYCDLEYTSCISACEKQVGVKRDITIVDLEGRDLDIKIEARDPEPQNIGNLASRALTPSITKYATCLYGCQKQKSGCVSDDLVGCPYYFNKCVNGCEAAVKARALDLDAILEARKKKYGKGPGYTGPKE